MRRDLGRGVELDDDPGRIDVDAVHAFLSGESYWAAGRTRDEVVLALSVSARVLGAYADGAQVGFARVVSDGVGVAYLADVYVLASHRGHGVGLTLVREAVEHPPHRDLLWLLRTADAHELYAKVGFRPASERLMERGH